MKIYSFEKLNCWIKAKEPSLGMSKITLNFPPEERFGLVSQMRRAAISIASNIAEGTARKSQADQTRFTVITNSSTVELLNDKIIILEPNFITEDTYEYGRKLIKEQTKLLSA